MERFISVISGVGKIGLAEREVGELQLFVDLQAAAPSIRSVLSFSTPASTRRCFLRPLQTRVSFSSKVGGCSSRFKEISIVPLSVTIFTPPLSLQRLCIYSVGDLKIFTNTFHDLENLLQTRPHTQCFFFSFNTD